MKIANDEKEWTMLVMSRLTVIQTRDSASNNHADRIETSQFEETAHDTSMLKISYTKRDVVNLLINILFHFLVRVIEWSAWENNASSKHMLHFPSTENSVNCLLMHAVYYLQKNVYSIVATLYTSRRLT